MTSQHSQKKGIRRRMAETGETYVAARAQLLSPEGTVLGDPGGFPAFDAEDRSAEHARVIIRRPLSPAGAAWQPVTIVTPAARIAIQGIRVEVDSPGWRKHLKQAHPEQVARLDRVRQRMAEGEPFRRNIPGRAGIRPDRPFHGRLPGGAFLILDGLQAARQPSRQWAAAVLSAAEPALVPLTRHLLLAPEIRSLVAYSPRCEGSLDEYTEAPAAGVGWTMLMPGALLDINTQDRDPAILTGRRYAPGSVPAGQVTMTLTGTVDEEVWTDTGKDEVVDWRVTVEATAPGLRRTLGKARLAQFFMATGMDICNRDTRYFSDIVSYHVGELVTRLLGPDGPYQAGPDPWMEQAGSLMVLRYLRLEPFAQGFGLGAAIVNALEKGLGNNSRRMILETDRCDDIEGCGFDPIPAMPGVITWNSEWLDLPAPTVHFRKRELLTSLRPS